MQDIVQPAELLSLQALPGRYTRLLLRLPQLITNPQPGLYCRIANNGPPACMPIMRADGEILECLYRPRNPAHLPENLLKNHQPLSVALEGNAWNPAPHESHIVFLAENEGLACVVLAASRLYSDKPQKTLTAFLEFDGSPPFTPKPSQILLPGAPADALACAPLLEDWGIASRLTDAGDHRIPKPGWFSGTAVELAEIWFDNPVGGNYRLVGCGSQRFIETVLKLADQRRLPADATVLPE